MGFLDIVKILALFIFFLLTFFYQYCLFVTSFVAEFWERGEFFRLSNLCAVILKFRYMHLLLLRSFGEWKSEILFMCSYGSMVQKSPTKRFIWIHFSECLNSEFLVKIHLLIVYYLIDSNFNIRMKDKSEFYFSISSFWGTNWKIEHLFLVR